MVSTRLEKHVPVMRCDWFDFAAQTMLAPIFHPLAVKTNVIGISMSSSTKIFLAYCHSQTPTSFPRQYPVSTETLYFLFDAALRLYAVRTRWLVENNYRWTLDVVFHGDDAGLRVGNGAANFAILRHLALSILKCHPAKLGLNCKHLKATLSEFSTFLMCLLWHNSQG